MSVPPSGHTEITVALNGQGATDKMETALNHSIKTQKSQEEWNASECKWTPGIGKVVFM